MAVIAALLLATLATATPVRNAGRLAMAMIESRKANWGPVVNYQRYARLFVVNGRRWKVDPVIVACVAYAESRYHVEAARLYRTRCKSVKVGCSDKPGPCRWLPDAMRWRKTCKRVWINTAETGMMQVLYHSKNAFWGYGHCAAPAGRKRQR